MTQNPITTAIRDNEAYFHMSDQEKFSYISSEFNSQIEKMCSLGIVPEDDHINAIPSQISEKYNLVQESMTDYSNKRNQLLDALSLDRRTNIVKTNNEGYSKYSTEFLTALQKLNSSI